MSRDLLERYRHSSELEAAQRLLGTPGARLGCLGGGSLAFFLGCAYGRGEAPGPCLVVAPSPEEADELSEELEVFSPGRVLPFPAWDSLVPEPSFADAEICRQRLGILNAVRNRAPTSFVVCSVQALLQPVPPPEALDRDQLELRTGLELPPGRLAEQLLERGYRHTGLVEGPGEFSSRGDVFDVFPYPSRLPLRLEFFGDQLESVRDFDPESQRSIPESRRATAHILLLRLADLFPATGGDHRTLLLDYLGAQPVVVVKDPEAARDRARRVLDSSHVPNFEAEAERFCRRLQERQPHLVWSLPAPPGAGASLDLGFRSVEAFGGLEPEDLFRALDARLASGDHLEIYCESDAEAKRFRDLLGDHGITGDDRLLVKVGDLRRGFAMPHLQATILTTREIFNRRTVRRFRRRRRAAQGRTLDSFLELERGSFVVHLVHGIGRFLGTEFLEKDGVEQEFLAIEFRHGVKLYVPVSKIDLIQKYVGSGDHVPVLDRIGGSAWKRKKESVEAALLDLASELLELQALRRERPGIAFPEDSEWQRQFENSFPYDETPDQLEVGDAIKSDMVAPRPMDRLICGDVGYGKTELAMRAAFKAIDAGRQVAVLVPTTVLAEQHFRTFRERMVEFPVTLEVLSRFRTRAQQKEILERTAAGAVDILIGTHRLLSKDVSFRDLGLIIIDEEQRFGVIHKEKLKKLRSQVDVLTLSATPIPRTLHMALLGIRDISSLTTPPEDRSAIHTEISHVDREKIREAIQHELNRDGQVYFVHNRVLDIETVTRDLLTIVPEARIDFVHGQMNEHLLEKKMMRFLDGKIDVLVATTIIENGIDIPNVNTIFINEADRYGLADLHQLRGRVGRYKHQAYCHLLLPPHRHVSPEARKRLQALVEYSGLGAGFQIAMRDLEIRGTGNILGREQSGHIATVGYDLYCRLLEKCVRQKKDESYTEPVRVEVELSLPAFLPAEYVPDESLKLATYRRISSASRHEEVTELASELTDRFGPFPHSVRRLLELQAFRVRCSQLGIEYVGRQDGAVVFKGDERLRRLLDGCPQRLIFLDGRTVALPLAEFPKTFALMVDDERLFDLLCEWLASGRFPRRGGRRQTLVDLRAASCTTPVQSHDVSEGTAS